jgi:hypothetical protein
MQHRLLHLLEERDEQRRDLLRHLRVWVVTCALDHMERGMQRGSNQLRLLGWPLEVRVSCPHDDQRRTRRCSLLIILLHYLGMTPVIPRQPTVYSSIAMMSYPPNGARQPLCGAPTEQSRLQIGVGRTHSMPCTSSRQCFLTCQKTTRGFCRSHRSNLCRIPQTSQHLNNQPLRRVRYAH